MSELSIDRLLFVEQTSNEQACQWLFCQLAALANVIYFNPFSASTLQETTASSLNWASLVINTERKNGKWHTASLSAHKFVTPLLCVSSVNGHAFRR